MSVEKFEKLPKLSESYALSKDVAKEYQENGHVVLREVCTAVEVEAYRQEINEIVKQHILAKTPMKYRDTYGKAFVQVCNLWRESETVKRFVLAKRFGRIAAELMGVGAGRLIQTRRLPCGCRSLTSLTKSVR